MINSPKKDQPLYYQVREHILHKLATHEWIPGERIPTEPELAALFAVSVGTVRKAIEDLVAENILIRRARIGTTVATHENYNPFSTFFNFLSKTGKPLYVENQLLVFNKIKASRDFLYIFNVSETENLFVIDNLRLVDKKAVMYDRIWLPEKQFKGLNKRNFENRPGSIYAFFQNQFRVTVLRIKEQLEATQAPDFVQSPLEVKKRDAILKITRQAISYGDEVVEFRNRYVNTNACQYLNEIGLKE